TVRCAPRDVGREQLARLDVTMRVGKRPLFEEPAQDIARGLVLLGPGLDRLWRVEPLLLVSQPTLVDPAEDCSGRGLEPPRQLWVALVVWDHYVERDDEDAPPHRRVVTGHRREMVGEHDQRVGRGELDRVLAHEV